MNTELALPKIDVTPKPTKGQMIEALVERERELWKEKRESIKARIEPLTQEMEAECFYLMSTTSKDAYRFSTNNWRHEQHCDASIRLKSPKLTNLIKKIEKINGEAPSWFNEDAVKAKIKEAMATPKKENPLLNNPDVKQALDSIMSQISNKPLAIEAQEVEIVTDK